MKVKTITCHDVYNAGASLQAYALMQYIISQGHDVEIIDYKPDYLSRHYSFSVIGNPKYEKNAIIKCMYLIAKFPGRLQARLGRRKKNYDLFKQRYLKVTEKRYTSNEQLAKELPEADIYLAGSDQIWNPVFENGRDPAFYLDFVPDNKVKASYAASFSVEEIPEEEKAFVKTKLERLDNISVREQSGLSILKNIQIENGRCVLDPVFLLTDKEWDVLCKQKETKDKYILVYDFDNSALIQKVARRISEEKGCKIYSFYKTSYADRTFHNEGPIGFLKLIKNAECVIGNSFHAVAFSLIYKKEFIVVKRKENLNTRMQDLLALVKLQDRMLDDIKDFENLKPIDYKMVEDKLAREIALSKMYLQEVLRGDILNVT